MKRRHFLKGAAATPLLAGAHSWASNPMGSFDHGIASGDPDETSVVLWTRISGFVTPVDVVWQVALDDSFVSVVASGSETTSELIDFTVKVIATGLTSGVRYFYRFICGDTVSEVGQTQTLPVGALETLGLAIASCSNYPFGYFNAYEAIAEDEAIDFVLHLGDYIYEYAATGWGAEAGLSLNRAHRPITEIVTLTDYRERHAQYKSDPDSRKMHAAKPLLLVWDDHESANNPWVGGAQNHQSPAEGRWIDRRAASIRAYYEWMPIREPKIGEERRALWRSYRFGNLAQLITLETRHTARAKQIDYADYLDIINSQKDADEFVTNVLNAPGREMLSTDMKQFLSDELSQSVEQSIPWRLIGNAIPMAKTPVPNLAEKGFEMPTISGSVPGVSADLIWKGRWNLPFYPDTWDGYPWAREKFYELCQRVGAEDLLVLTGDSHSFWANYLRDQSGNSMGLEIGTAGITSPGDFVEQGFDTETAHKIDLAFMEFAPDIHWTTNLHQGYVRLCLNKDYVDADYMAVSTVFSKDYLVTRIHNERIAHSGQHLDFL